MLFTNARDESRILEWVLHHQSFGFDRIHIIDHLSKTPIATTLSTCVKQYDNVIIERNNNPKAIKKEFNHHAIAVSKKLGYDWLLYLDADEFLYLKDHTSIHNFIATFPHNTAKIAINWLMFGSNNKATSDPKKTMLEEFTQSENRLHSTIKSIVRVAWMANKPPPHPHTYTCVHKEGYVFDIGGRMHSLANQNTQASAQMAACQKIPIDTAKAFVAHYTSQDYDTYCARKLDRRRDDIIKAKRSHISEETFHNMYNDRQNHLMLDSYNDQLREKLNALAELGLKNNVCEEPEPKPPSEPTQPEPEPKPTQPDPEPKPTAQEEGNGERAKMNEEDKTPEPAPLDKLGFIVLRCVKKPVHNLYWNRCVASINKHYPECQIKVIDDHSATQLVKATQPHSNLEIINSGFSAGSGEILPYYYYFTRGADWFEQAVILHDSTIIQSRLRDVSAHGYVPLWHFNSRICEEKVLQAKIVNHCEPKRRAAINRVMANKKLWTGCFGAMSIVRYVLLYKTLDKNSFQKMTEVVRTRHERMAVERIIPCIMYSYNPSLQKGGVLGDIHGFPGHHHLPYNQYAAQKAKWAKYPLVKYWSGR